MSQFSKPISNTSTKLYRRSFSSCRTAGRLERTASQALLHRRRQDAVRAFPRRDAREGITIAAPGFYAPQGRWVRLEPQDARLNEKIESFDYHGRRITNFEMEGSALAGLAALMGHRAATICTIIAQRIAQNVDTDYKPFVRKMISTALDKLAVLE